MAETPTNITVNLSAEDRALLQKIADLLTRNEDPAVPESIRRLTEREFTD